MKKLILLLSACTTLVACKSDNNGVSDTLSSYLDVYAALAANQHTAMDPFLIAYRYHLYQAAGETATAKSQYLPDAEITKSIDGQTVTLAFTPPAMPPTDDFMREGEVTIHTFGTSLLDQDAVWQITTTGDYNLTDLTMVDAGLGIQSDDEYLISHLGEGRWRVQADAIYLSSYFWGMIWNWDVDVIATRSSDRMTVEGTNAPLAGGGVSINAETAARYRYEILDPLVYDFDCGLLVKSAGKERIVRTDMKDYRGLDSLVLDRGTSAASCTPGFSFSVRDEADSLWTTHQYGPNGEWLY